mgnify:CR=1 FL=1
MLSISRSTFEYEGVRGASIVRQFAALVVSTELWLAIGMMLGRSPLDRFIPGIRLSYSASCVAWLAAIVCAIPRMKSVDRAGAATVVWITSVLAVTVASLSWSKSFDYGSDKAFGFLISVYVPAILISLLRVDQKKVAISFCVIGFALLLGASTMGIAALIWQPMRLSAFGGGPNTFGRFMVTAAISAVSLRGPMKPVAIVAFILGLVFSQSRGAFLSGIAAALLYLVSRGDSKKRLSTASALTVMAALAGMWFVAPSQLRLGLLDRFTSITVDVAGGGAIAARKLIAGDALAAFLGKPIAGWGLGSFEHLSIDRYPHNLFLEVLCEQGLVGATVILTPLLAMLGRVLTIRVSSKGHDQPAPYWYLASLVAAQFSGDIVDSRMVFLFAILLWTQKRTRQSLGFEVFARAGDNST